jgi:hypothetical protein
MLFMDEVAEKIYFGQDSQNDSHYHKYLGMCPPKKGGHIGSTPGTCIYYIISQWPNGITCPYHKHAQNPNGPNRVSVHFFESLAPLKKGNNDFMPRIPHTSYTFSTSVDF